MKHYLTISFFLSIAFSALGQKASHDSTSENEPVAIAELGGAAGLDLKGGGWSYGYDLAVEVTPIGDWLELELGVTPVFGPHLKELDIDLLFKKPWTLSRKLEFMAGIGPAWSHADENGVITNTFAGEAALDFMYWPSIRHRFGIYLEPAYEYGFGKAHDQSLGISGGLLVAIP
jgi:hypothetical protein